MQKMNLKTTLVSTVFAVFAVVLTFAGSVGEARADNSAGKFSVTLQTPFVKIPEALGSCANNKDAKSNYQTAGGYDWVCAKGSNEWQQVISGDDGGEILQNYAGALYKWLAGFIGLAAVLLIVVGGIQISTAGANQEGLQSGKDRILAALVGLALLFLSGLILFTINPTFFN